MAERDNVDPHVRDLLSLCGIPSAKTSAFFARKITLAMMVRMNKKHFLALGVTEGEAARIEDALLTQKGERRKRAAADRNDDDNVMSEPCRRDGGKKSAHILTKVAIIGTSGRNKDPASQQLTASLFARMVEQAETVIRYDFSLHPCNVVLVSGGAAWSDHVAVKLFLTGQYAGLYLFLPCAWQGGDQPQHVEKPPGDDATWKSNPGMLANACHARFSAAVGYDTLAEMELARTRGAVFDSSYFGFHRRNTAVADSPFLLAFSWSRDEHSLSSGTRDTWGKSRGVKKHVSLLTLQVAEEEPPPMLPPRKMPPKGEKVERPYAFNC